MSKNEQQKRGGFVSIGDLAQRPATHLTHLTRTGVKMLVVAFLVLGYSTRVSDATLADVLLAEWCSWRSVPGGDGGGSGEKRISTSEVGFNH